MRKNLFLVFTCSLALLLTGCASAMPDASSGLASPAVSPSPVPDVHAGLEPQPASPGLLTATFFSCGDADSTLIQAGGYTVLIDTATNKEGKNVVKRLAQMGVNTIDLLIISHPHKDHVGGADHVLENFTVKQVVQGPLEIDSKQVDQFSEALAEKKLASRVLRLGDTISLGDMHIEVVGPLRDAYEEENDLSLVFRLTWGDTAFLFPGDAEKLALNDMLITSANLRADVLKVPHHGKGEDNSQLFFKAVSPSVAIIPCERGTKDNLPEQARVVRPLEALGAQVFVTHDGEIRVESDGHTVTAAQSSKILN